MPKFERRILKRFGEFDWRQDYAYRRFESGSCIVSSYHLSTADTDYPSRPWRKAANIPTQSSPMIVKAAARSAARLAAQNRVDEAATVKADFTSPSHSD